MKQGKFIIEAGDWLLIKKALSYLRNRARGFARAIIRVIRDKARSSLYNQ